MKKISDEILEVFDEITEQLLREKSYMDIILGYCENEMHESEIAEKIYVIIHDIITQHDNLCSKYDGIIMKLMKELS